MAAKLARRHHFLLWISQLILLLSSYPSSGLAGSLTGIVGGYHVTVLNDTTKNEPVYGISWTTANASCPTGNTLLPSSGIRANSSLAFFSNLRTALQLPEITLFASGTDTYRSSSDNFTISHAVTSSAPAKHLTACFRDIDECRSGNHTCVSGQGSCQNTVGSYLCTCASGWTGANCHTNLNECLLGNPCGSGGTCVDEQGSYICACHAGWTGERCKVDIDECRSQDIIAGGAEQPCKNSGRCQNSNGGFTCVCTPHWTGPTCAVSNSGNGNGKLTSSAFDITVFGVVVGILCILILVAALVLCRMKHVEQVNALRFDGRHATNSAHQGEVSLSPKADSVYDGMYHSFSETSKTESSTDPEPESTLTQAAGASAFFFKKRGGKFRAATAESRSSVSSECSLISPSQLSVRGSSIKSRGSQSSGAKRMSKLAIADGSPNAMLSDGEVIAEGKELESPAELESNHLCRPGSEMNTGYQVSRRSLRQTNSSKATTPAAAAAGDQHNANKTVAHRLAAAGPVATATADTGELFNEEYTCLDVNTLSVAPSAVTTPRPSPAPQQRGGSSEYDHAQVHSAVATAVPGNTGETYDAVDVVANAEETYDAVDGLAVDTDACHSRVHRASNATTVIPLSPPDTYSLADTSLGATGTQSILVSEDLYDCIPLDTSAVVKTNRPAHQGHEEEPEQESYDAVYNLGVVTTPERAASDKVAKQPATESAADEEALYQDLPISQPQQEEEQQQQQEEAEYFTVDSQSRLLLHSGPRSAAAGPEQGDEDWYHQLPSSPPQDSLLTADQRFDSAASGSHITFWENGDEQSEKQQRKQLQAKKSAPTVPAPRAQSVKGKTHLSTKTSLPVIT
eukprot:scpid77776/ scgid30862/ Neurogenic locus notch homolog protein 3; Notch 3 extracellular truncation; Notch 3 intracellular domain